LDASDICAGGSEAVDEVELCMEKRLDWELEGVRAGLEAKAADDD